MVREMMNVPISHPWLPLRAAQDCERHQHQQRQEADALGDDAESGCGPANRVPAPRRAEQQMAQQAVQAQRRPETQRRVDLRLPRLPHELHGEEQREPRREPGLAIPQAAGEVVDEADAAKPGEERRQQERDAQGARHLEAHRDQPEK
jgi:hypothetical protein